MFDRRGLVRHALCATFCAAAPSVALASGDKKDKKKGGGLTFIQFSTLTATIVRPDGRRGVLTVEAGVHVPDEKLRERAILLTPRLQDAYGQAVRTAAASLRPGWPPDPDQLARTLQKATDATLGQPGAKFLLGVVMVN